MKRPHVPVTHTASPTFPLLCWRRCNGCGMEFRREWGWADVLEWGSDDPLMPSDTIWGYACAACGPEAITRLPPITRPPPIPPGVTPRGRPDTGDCDCGCPESQRANHWCHFWQRNVAF